MAYRLLVIDDDPIVRETLLHMLQFEGYEVQTAEGAEEAFALLQPGKFDLVITDYCMPRMDGAQLAAAIKDRDPKQRVLMITAHAESVKGLPKGVDILLCKPFSINSLRGAMAPLLPRG
jgi:two-component system, OmpR family, response regulator MprA